MVAMNGEETYNLLISDFGTCVGMWDRSGKRTGNTGTLEYLAPELLINATSTDWDPAGDIWSLGVILYCMSFSCLPFLSANVQFTDNQKLISEIINFRGPVFPASPQRSGVLREVITSLLQVDPRKRPSMADILSSPILQNISSHHSTEGHLDLAVGLRTRPMRQRSRETTVPTVPTVTGVKKVSRDDRRINGRKSHEFSPADLRRLILEQVGLILIYLAKIYFLQNFCFPGACQQTSLTVTILLGLLPIVTAPRRELKKWRLAILALSFLFEIFSVHFGFACVSGNSENFGNLRIDFINFLATGASIALVHLICS
eukprot:TRINITY_DN6719_c0_g1_i3.p1 TRINITY_DN6719_c0_g1~~TRINITY_DN6719_c0_g1_i3.p1  ORF type:complete len:316 (+),score=73.03 TRINITY_DN6719_c0_g1_i3:218-1165(+)